MTYNKDYLIFLDLETTGLNIQNDLPLEVAALVVDTATLTVRDTYTKTIIPALDWEAKLAENPKVHTMHTTNGLIDAVRDTGKPLERVVHEIRVMLAKFSAGKSVDTFRLAGTCVSCFDLPFMKCQIPELAELFHYRTVDVAILKEWIDTYGRGVHYPGTGSNHRALADCHTSLEMARKLREYI